MTPKNVSGGQAAPDGPTPRLSEQQGERSSGKDSSLMASSSFWSWGNLGSLDSASQSAANREMNFFDRRSYVETTDNAREKLQFAASQQLRSTASPERKCSRRGLPQITMLVNVPIGRD